MAKADTDCLRKAFPHTKWVTVLRNVYSRHTFPDNYVNKITLTYEKKHTHKLFWVPNMKLQYSCLSNIYFSIWNRKTTTKPKCCSYTNTARWTQVRPGQRIFGTFIQRQSKNNYLPVTTHSYIIHPKLKILIEKRQSAKTHLMYQNLNLQLCVSFCLHFSLTQQKYTSFCVPVSGSLWDLIKKIKLSAQKNSCLETAELGNTVKDNVFKQNSSVMLFWFIPALPKSHWIHLNKIDYFKLWTCLSFP